MAETKILAPHPGKQSLFLATSADLAIYGGSAGGGKSYALILEQLRHSDNSGFRSILFRRTVPQLMQQGGLVDTARGILPLFGAVENKVEHQFTFKSGAQVKFSGMQYEDDCYQHDGAQYALICFDELIHFTEKQFFYLLTRNRSVCGVRPYVRCTTNPRKSSWVKELIRWWLDDDGAYAREDRAGVIRWMVRRNNVTYWADTPEELTTEHPGSLPRSVTFIPAALSDNLTLERENPEYRSNLMAATQAEQDRLLHGNWNVDDEKGDYFREHYFPVVRNIPDLVSVVRFWDRAATKPSESNKDPDYTAGALMGKTRDGKYILLHIHRMRDTPGQVRAAIRQFAEMDRERYGGRYSIALEEEPGASGKSEAESLVSFLAGYRVKRVKATGNKEHRAAPLSSQAEISNVLMLEGDWNRAWIAEAENFPNGAHDDQVDAVAGAFNELTSKKSGFSSNV